MSSSISDVNAIAREKVQASINEHLDNSVKSVGSFVNWPNPDDHWSDIPLDRLDKWKEWGVKESQNAGDDGGGVKKRRVDPTSYQPQQQLGANVGPKFIQGIGLYHSPKSGFIQHQFQTPNSSPIPQNPSNGHNINPFPQFPTPVHSSPALHTQPTQNSYLSPNEQSLKEPPQYHSGFFPSNILVEYPETPILSHPELKSDGLNHPQFISQTVAPLHQGINNVGIHGLQETRYKKHTSNYMPYNLNRIQETPYNAKTPEFNFQNVKNFRDPVQIRPFVQFNLKDSVEPYHGRGEFPSTDVNNQQLPFMNYISNEQDDAHRRQSSGEPRRQQPFNNLEDEMSAAKPPRPDGRFAPPSPFGPRPPRYRMNRPRRKLPGPRRPNNANFGPPQGPLRRRNNGRQFHGDWNRPEDRYKNQQKENITEEDFQPSQTLETNEEVDPDDFYEDEFFKDPDFENFDFSDFEEFQVFDSGENINGTANEQTIQEENDDYSKTEYLFQEEDEEKRSETEMGNGHDMDFNYSRDALEMFKRRQKKEYQEQTDNFDNKETRKESPRSDNDESVEKFLPNFVLESDKDLEYSETPYRPHHEKVPQSQEKFQMSQEILDYEKNDGGRDPFNKFEYKPSPDDDFAEFDKYFNGFDESIENNLDTNFREGRQAAVNKRREMERTKHNEETLDKLQVITEPFDISDLNHDDQVSGLVSIFKILWLIFHYCLLAKYLRR